MSINQAVYQSTFERLCIFTKLYLRTRNINSNFGPNLIKEKLDIISKRSFQQGLDGNIFKTLNGFSGDDLARLGEEVGQMIESDLNVVKAFTLQDNTPIHTAQIQNRSDININAVKDLVHTANTANTIITATTTSMPYFASTPIITSNQFDPSRFPLNAFIHTPQVRRAEPITDQNNNNNNDTLIPAIVVSPETALVRKKQIKQRRAQTWHEKHFQYSMRHWLLTKYKSPARKRILSEIMEHLKNTKREAYETNSVDAFQNQLAILLRTSNDNLSKAKAAIWLWAYKKKLSLSASSFRKNIMYQEFDKSFVDRLWGEYSRCKHSLPILWFSIDSIVTNIRLSATKAIKDTTTFDETVNSFLHDNTFFTNHFTSMQSLDEGDRTPILLQ